MHDHASKLNTAARAIIRTHSRSRPHTLAAGRFRRGIGPRNRATASAVRAAYTLIELLITIGLIGILLGLTLPAVQQARESARRLKCLDNLKQIGIAIHAYSAVNKSFPPGGLNSKKYRGFHSIFSRLLPYLDQYPLYNSVNFSPSTYPLDTPWIPDNSPLHARYPIRVNETAYTTSISGLLCPSDTGSFSATGCNYRGNTGVGPYFLTIAETPDSGNGLFPELEIVDEAKVIDGLSQTACVSERLRGLDSTLMQPSRVYFKTPQSGVFTADTSLLTCRIYGRANNPAVYTDSGSWWFWTGKERTLYNHTQSPNGIVPDCIHGQVVTSAAMSTARSMHPGNVQVLFGDGSVRGIRSQISQSVWRSLGTRAGGEVVDVGAW